MSPENVPKMESEERRSLDPATPDTPRLEELSHKYKESRATVEAEIDLRDMPQMKVEGPIIKESTKPIDIWNSYQEASRDDIPDDPYNRDVPEIIKNSDKSGGEKKVHHEAEEPVLERGGTSRRTSRVTEGYKKVKDFLRDNSRSRGDKDTFDAVH